MDILFKIYDYYEKINALYGYYELGFEVFLIIVIIYKIIDINKKILNQNNWTETNRLNGLRNALNSSIYEKSKISLSLNFLFIVSILFGSYGIYMSYSNNEYLEFSLSLTSLCIWTLIGILSIILSIRINQFNKKNYEYHLNWVKDNFKDYIYKAKDLFAYYSLFKIFDNDDDSIVPLKPFIYINVKGKKRNWIDTNFFDQYYFTAIFPDKKTCLFFINEPSSLILNIDKTIEMFYTSEFFKENNEDKNDNEIINFIKNYKLSESLLKLDYESTGLENDIIVKSFKDINPKGIKALNISMDKFEYEELFYSDVVKVTKDSSRIILKFKHGDEKQIKSSQINSKFEENVFKEIQKIIREVKQ